MAGAAGLSEFRFAEFRMADYLPAMSTLVEIQDAVAKLRNDEKQALTLWLNSQTEPAISPREERQLLRSLDEALRDVDGGKGVPLEELHRRVASWAAR